MSGAGLTFGSLFAGIGGFDLGFERAGFTCKWQVEIDEYCRAVLAKHWPDVERLGDVRKVGKDNLKRVDVICGGFPCQDISEANANGKGLDGELSGLWWEYHRIIGELRPHFAVVENVSNLTNRGLARVLGSLAEIGYDSEWETIPACAFGAPHTRERMYIVAYPNGERQEASGRNGNAHDPKIFTGRARQEYLHTIAVASGGESGTPWSREPSMARMDDGIPNRVDRNRGLGNAVVPQVAEWIARHIAAADGRPA